MSLRRCGIGREQNVTGQSTQFNGAPVISLIK